MTKKKDSLQASQDRLDWYEDAIDYATRPAEKTAEGFLIARAPVTSVGVFLYRNDDGTPRRELRLPEEVFNPDSLETLKLKPLTLLHPGVVTPENVEKVQVGSVGSDIYTDSYRVYIDLAATKKDGIEAVEDGSARSLSCGYKCDIEWTSGTWMGMPFDCIQRNIRYNHVALVPTPRAGDGNAIRMDGAGEPDPKNPKSFEQHNQEEGMNLKTIHLDGADYQAEPQVIAALDKAQNRADGLEKELNKVREDAKSAEDALKAEKSTVEAERDSLKERLDAIEKDMPGKIESAVQNRLELVGKATAAGVEVKADMADLEIKKAVIAKVFPSANLDGKDEAYVAARFDCACEIVSSEADKKSRKDAADIPPQNHEDSAQEKLEASRKAYNARMDGAWKDEPKNNKEA